MKARVKWIEDHRFMGITPSGHGVMMEAKGPGQGGVAPSPMEMLLLGMGGCSSIDVVLILEKMRQTVVDVEVELDATRADTDPKVFTKIHAHFIVKGKDLKEAKVREAVRLSADKYCSASIMLGAMAEITHDVTVIEV